MFIGMEWPSLCRLGLIKLLLYRSDKVAKIGITKDRENMIKKTKRVEMVVFNVVPFPFKAL